MNKLNLNNVTLVAISSVKISETISAINHCLNLCNFKNIIFFTDVDSQYTYKINKLNNTTDYNNFVYYDLPNKIDDDFILIIQWDGFIINTSAWTDKFLNYDYIGAPWPWRNHQCGNGGFSLRSKKFLNIQKQMSQKYQLKPDIDLSENEDVMLSFKLRNKFIEHGCSYAPSEISYKFSTEYGDYNINKSFGFHNFNLHPEFKNIIGI